MKINSKLIKKLRNKKNWSQEQLSEASGLSLRTIQRLENGGNGSIESVRALSVAFNIEADKLILSKEEITTTPLDAVKTGLFQFMNFSGTASRYEYGWFLLFVLFTLAIATVIHEKAFQVAALILLVPFIAVGTRRLNDINRSAWWQMFFLVPFGQVIVFYMLAQTNDTLTNNP